MIRPETVRIYVVHPYLGWKAETVDGDEVGNLVPLSVNGSKITPAVQSDIHTLVQQILKANA